MWRPTSSPTWRLDSRCRKRDDLPHPSLLQCRGTRIERGERRCNVVDEQHGSGHRRLFRAERAEQRRLQLAAVLAILDQLGAYADPAARELVANAYQQGADRAAEQIAGLRIDAPEVPGSFAGVSADAVKALQDSMVGNLRAARETVGRQVNDIYAKAGRRAALRAILGAEGSPQSARRQLARDLLTDPEIARSVAQGGAAFVDRAGKRWSLEAYTGMAIRTTTREAVVQGAVARMVSHNVTLGRIATHEGPCDICKQYIGRLVDLSGDTSEFDGEAVMSGPLPPFHPRCRCNVSPVSVRVERVRRELGIANEIDRAR